MTNSRILKVLQVKPEEAKVVFFTILFALCLGIAQNILYSIPLSMFLSIYHSSLLPFIYIGTGILMFFFGIALSCLEKKVAVFYTLSIPVVAFSTVLFLFWGLLFFVKASWMIIVLFICSLSIALLITSIVLLLINQLFTFQQSKRVYGLIFGALATGGAVMGFGMPFFLKFISPHNLILLAAVMLLLGFAIQFLVKKYSGNRLLSIQQEHKGSADNISLKSFKDKNYIVYSYLLTISVYFTYFIFDLLFNTVVQKQFPGELEMASFYGVLNAVYDIAALVVTFFLSGWILSRFGLIVSLFIFPVGFVILLTGACLVNEIPMVSGIFFGILVMIAVFSIVVRDNITSESLLLLFQPLKSAQRVWAQIKNETTVTPLAIAVIGGVLAVVTKYFSVKTTVTAFMIIGLSLIAAGIIFFRLKDGYLKLLIESLSKRSIIQPQFTKLHQESLSLLKSQLTSPYPEEVIYVIKTIENIDHDELTKVLLETLDSPSREVRFFSLHKIEKYRIKAMVEKVKQICLKEKNPIVLGCAIQALGAITDLEQIPWFKNYSFDANSEIRTSSIIALIKYGSEVTKKEVIANLCEKVKSSQEGERELVANVLYYVDVPNKIDLLLTLLKDPSPEVKVAACRAASHVVDKRLYPALIENLGVSHVHKAAFNALIALGKSLCDYIVIEFGSFSSNQQFWLIKLLGFIKEEAVVHFLVQLLPSASRMLLYPTLLALKRHSYKASDDSQKIIRSLLESENKNIVYLKEIAISFNFEKTKLLHDLICREIELSQECCFLLLSFIYQGSCIAKAQEGLLLGDEDMKSNAVELLLQTLDKTQQELIMNQLIDVTYKKEVAAIPVDAKMEEFLLKVIDHTPQCFMPILLAAVIYTIGVLQLKNLTEVVRNQELKKDPLMQEIVLWTLKRLSLA